MMKRLSPVLFIISMLTASSGLADPLAGEKTLSFLTPDGKSTAVGRVHFAPDGDASGYEILWDDTRFSNHFLSMRPFRCMEGPDKNWCHVPYPYENQRRVTHGDLTDLEYDLLFLWKNTNDYGINLWNGLYYKLAIDDGRIVGRLHEIDMNTLSAPPPAGDLRPVQQKDLHQAEAESHWLPVVVIE